jgi:hypothetical protein
MVVVNHADVLDGCISWELDEFPWTRINRGQGVTAGTKGEDCDRTHQQLANFFENLHHVSI